MFVRTLVIVGDGSGVSLLQMYMQENHWKLNMRIKDASHT